MRCYVTLSNVFYIIRIKKAGSNQNLLTRYVVLLFVFNADYLKSNFGGFRRFLIHGNLCGFIIIYTMFKV